MKNALPALLAAVALVACEQTTSPAASDGGGGNPPTTDAAATSLELTAHWGPLEVAPGEEDTRCVTVSLGNETSVRIHEVENQLGNLSHHLIVYRVPDQETIREEPYPCDPFVDTFAPDSGSPVMVSQTAEERLVLPEGVAFTFAANQKIRLELHFINTTDETQSATASATFVSMREEDFVHEADFLFIGSPDVSLSPGKNTLGPIYFPLPSIFEGSKFFAITGHTHHWGTDVRVATTTSESGADTPVYELDAFSWDEPETVRHAPPFEVPPGGGYRFTCEWDNQSGGSVEFGESANDEMCFFWAYYYPSQGSRVCVHTEQAGGQDVCCPGDALCAFFGQIF